MNTDTLALLLTVLLFLAMAAWVPFLDTCAGCLERRKQRRAAGQPRSQSLVSETSSAPKREQSF